MRALFRSPAKMLAARRALASALATAKPVSLRAKLCIAAAIFLLSFFTKSLQAVDLAPLMYTSEQPFGGLTLWYDERAVSILEGEGLLGPYNIKPSRTKNLAQAPGYAIFLSAVYSVAGRNFFNVQLAQNLLNSLSPVLIFLIAGALVSWRVGAASGVLAAISHHFSHFSNFILPDTLSAIPILLSVYLLLLARRRGFDRRWYLIYAAAGLSLGLATWIRSQSLLMGLFFIPVLVLIAPRRREELKRAALMAVASLLAVAPITIRNYVVYGAFVPVNIGIGQVLWGGIGETDRGPQFGASHSDDGIAEQEAIIYNDPRYRGSAFTPDGIERDRERTKKSLNVILKHPVWYAGVMLDRMGEMVKYSAHAPLVYRASEVRGRGEARAVRPGWESISASDSALIAGESITWMRAAIRAVQRAAKETMLPFIVIGLAAAFILSKRRLVWLLAVPVYFFIFQSAMHTEFRYTLPMHYFLFVFAAMVWVLLGVGLWRIALAFASKR